MGLGSAMNSGISGLQAFSNSMSVIGNNLANTNTTGYKASRTLFADLIPNNVFGTGGVSQIGRGATLSKVDNIFSQGLLESTSSITDLAIEGSGFFIVRNPDSQTNYYTRAGAFRLNGEGQLINPEGYIVQGFQRLSDGSFSDFITNIQINTRSFVEAEATSQVNLTTNLNSQSEIKTWDINDPAATSNFSTTSLVYDSLGDTHLVTTYFNKIGTNSWQYHQTAPAADIDTTGDTMNDEETLVLVGGGNFEFDEQGILKSITQPSYDAKGTTAERDDFNDEAEGFAYLNTEDGMIYYIETAGDPPTWSAAGVEAATIVPEDSAWPKVNIEADKLDWKNGSATDKSIEYLFNLTQFATDSVVVTQESNGYASGNLSSIAIDNNGVISGIYSNGQSRDLAKLALSKFSNNSGLAKIGKNLFEATNESGPPDIGTSGSGVGKVFSYALEKSTVDIAEEFARMIITQRSFQANSKTITTTDEMLNEVINLKR
ncbi:MAG: flagellar hook protein FlgE [Desulfobacterales bacterium]